MLLLLKIIFTTYFIFAVPIESYQTNQNYSKTPLNGIAQCPTDFSVFVIRKLKYMEYLDVTVVILHCKEIVL